MEFIDRKQEMKRLNRLTSSENGGLAVIWGRRRLGKTRLLLEWSQKHKGIYFTADESSPTLQRKYFSLAIDQILPGFSSVEYPDWPSLLLRFAKDAFQIGWRGPLIIDELPYIIAASPEFASVLQKFVDHEAKNMKLIIALCGSSQRMMQSAILNASSPLYGRANEIIKLTPISVGYMGEALELKNPIEIIQAYSIWGGIPRYWELVKNHHGSFIENIDHIVLDPMGALNDEPNRLLLEDGSINLRPILDAIGLGAHRLSEIAAKIGQRVTSFSRMIQRLLELDLIEKEIPFGILDHHSKRTLYKIKDPFIRFWFEVVAPQRSFFSQASPKHRQRRLKESLQKILSISWEDICRTSIPFLPLQDDFGKASRYWHGNGPEWDIIAESVDAKTWLIGESKWVDKMPTIQWVYKTIEQLKNKGIPKIDRKANLQIIYALFIPKKPPHLKLPANVKVFDATDILNVES